MRRALPLLLLLAVLAPGQAAARDFPRDFLWGTAIAAFQTEAGGKPSHADRRRSILNLSEEGHRVHDEVAPLALQFERDLLHGLKDEEIDVFNIVMERLLAKARLLGTP